MQPYQTNEQRRKRERNQVLGDALWSYATNPIVPQYEGTLIDLSKFGLGMLTVRPVRDASIIRIYAKGLWKGAKYATVMWCEELETNIYRSGLLFNESH